MNLPNWPFVIVTNIVTAIGAIISSKGSLYDKRRKWYRQLTKRGITVVILSAILISLLVLQEYNNSSKATLADNALKKETNSRDTAITNGIRRGVDENSKKLYDDISRAFSKQGLQIDTLRKEVKYVRDSARTIVNNNGSQPDPVLIMDSVIVEVKPDSIQHITFVMTSANAGSANYSLDQFVCVELSNGVKAFSQLAKFDETFRLAKDASTTTGFSVNRFGRAITIYLLVHGTFTNLDGTKKYPIDFIYQYDLKTNKIGILSTPFKDRIKKQFKSRFSLNY